jgi:hypothetical protein
MTLLDLHLLLMRHGDRRVLWSWRRMLLMTAVVWPSERYYCTYCNN